MDWVIDSTDEQTWVKVQKLYCTLSWHEKPLKMYKNHENKNEFLKLHGSSTLKHDIIRNQQIVYTWMYKCPELIQWKTYLQVNIWVILGKRQWTRTWTNSRRQWGTERPGVLQSIGSKRVRHNWATEQQKRKNSTERGRWIFTHLLNYYQFCLQ